MTSNPISFYPHVPSVQWSGQSKYKQFPRQCFRPKWEASHHSNEENGISCVRITILCVRMVIHAYAWTYHAYAYYNTRTHHIPRLSNLTVWTPICLLCPQKETRVDGKHYGPHHREIIIKYRDKMGCLQLPLFWILATSWGGFERKSLDEHFVHMQITCTHAMCRVVLDASSCLRTQ